MLYLWMDTWDIKTRLTKGTYPVKFIHKAFTRLEGEENQPVDTNDVQSEWLFELVFENEEEREKKTLT